MPGRKPMSTPNTIARAGFNGADDWRAAPRAPLGTGINQEQYSQGLPKFGPGDF